MSPGSSVRTVLPRLQRWLGLGGLLLLSMLQTRSQAQISLDGSLGMAGQLRGPNYTIPASSGQIRGANLFHSFGQFNLSAGESANFTGPGTIHNILGRVTGSTPSSIDGLIRSEIPGANLYLLNPRGVLFGPNASLEVSGSFHVSTADYLRLADGSRFSAHLSDRSVLTVAPPEAFGFLGPTPAPIAIQESVLRVPDGATLSLIGGDIAIQGNFSLTEVSTLLARGGRINLASVGAAGEVVLNAADQTPALHADTIERFGKIEVRDARLNVSGHSAGTVTIRGGRLLLDGGIVLAATIDSDGARTGVDVHVKGEISVTQGGAIQTLVQGAGRAGDIQMVAGHVDLSTEASIASNALGDTTGATGDMRIAVGYLTLTGGASIDNNVSSAGAGGSIAITAAEAIIITGRNSRGAPSGVFSLALSGSRGDAGHVTMSTPVLTLEEGVISTSTLGEGRAGDLVVDVGQLTLLGGARLSNSTLGAGRGGALTMTARETVTISGQGVDGLASGIDVASLAPEAGDAGRLAITASALSLDGGSINTDSTGTGRAGDIMLTVGRLSLTGRASIHSSTAGTGPGGSVTIVATDSITITGPLTGVSSFASNRGHAGRLTLVAPQVRLDGGSITATTFATGRAGDIMVEAEHLTLTGGASISSATAGTGHGGVVTLNAREAMTISGQSNINSFAFEASSGEAGRVSITAPRLSLDGGTIATTTAGSGRAGDIALEAGLLTLAGSSHIDSSTLSAGPAGDIRLHVGQVRLAEGSQISSTTAGGGAGGTVTVRAHELIHLTGRNSAGFASGLFSTAEAEGAARQLVVSAPTLILEEGGTLSARTAGAGRAGDISVEVGQLTLRDGALITSSTNGRGPAGTVTIGARDSITIAGQHEQAAILSNTAGTGDAGRVALTTRLLTLEGNALVETRTIGDGNAGTVSLQVGQLHLTGGAQIGSTSGIGTPEGMLTVGTGKGGAVTITATEAMSIAGHDPSGITPSGVFTQTAGVDEAGQITLTTPQLTMADRGRIGADTGGAGDAGNVIVQTGHLTLVGGAQISSDSGITVGERLFVGAGAGGMVAVTATDTATITGQDSGLSTSTRGVGRGGDISLQAQRLTLTHGARLAAESTGPGNAGNVTITTQAPVLLTNGSVVTRATQADGGNIQITTPTLLRLRDSTITAEVGGGASTVGGNITIDPQFVLLQNSQIVANAFAGQGGNISILAQQVFLADPASQVSASSALGINGRVDIQAPVTSISGAVAPLPQAFAQTTELLRSRCVERLREGTLSRFVVGGRDGVPLAPGSLLLSPLQRTGQEEAAPGEEHVTQHVVAQPGQIRYAPTPVPGELAMECARWR